MKKFLVAGIIACGFFIVMPILTWAQEAENAYLETSDGTVVAIDKEKNEITISEYYWSTDEEKEVVYSVPTNVELENVAAWQEIPVGSYVDIEYTVGQDNKRIAQYLSVYSAVSPEDTEEEVFVNE